MLRLPRCLLLPSFPPFLVLSPPFFLPSLPRSVLPCVLRPSILLYHSCSLPTSLSVPLFYPASLSPFGFFIVSSFLHPSFPSVFSALLFPLLLYSLISLSIVPSLPFCILSLIYSSFPPSISPFPSVHIHISSPSPLLPSSPPPLRYTHACTSKPS